MNLSVTGSANAVFAQQSQTQSVKYSGHHHHHGGGGGGSSAATDVTSPSFSDIDEQTAASSSQATVNGLTAADLQNQVAAASVLSQSQLQSMLLQSGSAAW